MVSKFQPENEMEQEIAGVLRANGVDEKKKKYENSKNWN